MKNEYACFFSLTELEQIEKCISKTPNKRLRRRLNEMISYIRKKENDSE